MKEKLRLDYRPYLILGTCNPDFANKALSTEPTIGLILPCNVILRQNSENSVEVAAIDPIASMSAVDNHNLDLIATEVQEKLKRVIDSL